MHPNYFAVFREFARNSLVREMTFRGNFLLDCVSSLSWVFMQLGLYLVIFEHTDQLGSGTGWGRWPFFVFLATTLFVNSLVQFFFMTNMEELSDLIRTGNLDFALLKPIDTQFLLSLRKFEWSSLANVVFAAILLAVSLGHLEFRPTPLQGVLYVVFILCGVALLYSLMIALGSVSVWLGRNESLYDFWFYITNFSRYPMEIYEGPFGTPLRLAFTFAVPILLVANVPARLLAWPFESQDWRLAGYAFVASLVALVASRKLFYKALAAYRSASS
ncbi:MAG: ABC transporter permease [Pirellula sp.]|nr:ABC transporter permease [Pirellula sp.]